MQRLFGEPSFFFIFVGGGFELLDSAEGESWGMGCGSAGIVAMGGILGGAMQPSVGERIFFGFCGPSDSEGDESSGMECSSFGIVALGGIFGTTWQQFFGERILFSELSDSEGDESLGMGRGYFGVVALGGIVGEIL